MTNTNNHKVGRSVLCTNGSSAEPCHRRPEIVVQAVDTGQRLGTVCGICAANMIESGKVYRSFPFRIEVY